MNLRRLLGGCAPEVAPLVLGMRLENVADGTSLIVTEVEAYTEDDPASHSFGGPTRRNRSMFADPGTLYVYRSYGIHWCANVVTGPAGAGEAVLLRGGLPERGIEVMKSRRGRADHLTDGPGKLCQAMAIDGDHDGTDLLGGPFRLTIGVNYGAEATTRVGITAGTDRLWRFVAREGRDSLPSQPDDT